MVLEKDQEEEEKGFEHVGCSFLVWLNVDIDEEDTCEHEMPEALSRKEELWSKHSTGGYKCKTVQLIQCTEVFYRKLCQLVLYAGWCSRCIPPTEESTHAYLIWMDPVPTVCVMLDSDHDWVYDRERVCTGICA